METSYIVRLNLPDSADPERVRAGLDDLLADVRLGEALDDELRTQADDTPFDGFVVERYPDTGVAGQLQGLRQQLAEVGLPMDAPAEALVRHWKGNAEALFALDMHTAMTLLGQVLSAAPADEAQTRARIASFIKGCPRTHEGYPDLPIAQALESLEATGNAWLRRNDDGTTTVVDTGELRIELDPQPASHSPVAPLVTEGWVAFLLAALVQCEQYLDAIPMIGPGGRAEGREALLGLLRPTLTRAEELASGSLADSHATVATVAAEVAAVAARQEG